MTGHVLLTGRRDAPAGRRSAPILLAVVGGFAVGTTYGIALRAWMRLISTDPEFSWGGTGYIVAVFVLLGTSAGLATALRARGHGRALLLVRAVGIILSLGCFVGAGAAMLPTVVPAALGRGRTDWPRWLRIGLVAVGSVSAVLISVFGPLAELAPGRMALGLVLYLALCVVEIELTARLYAPSLPGGTLRKPLRVALVVAVPTLLVGVVLLMRGVP
jgi:hypothetical protein